MRKIFIPLMVFLLSSCACFASTTASRQYDFTDDAANSLPISSSKMDNEFDNIITKLNQKVLIKSSSPSSPISGMLWYDSTNKLLKEYRNNEWVVHGIVHVGASAPSTDQEGDTWYETDTDKFQVYNGSSWIEIPTLSTSGTGAIIYSDGSDWTTLTGTDTNTAFLSNQGSNNVPAWTQISLSTNVTGTLPVTAGGLGNTFSSTAQGSIFYFSSTGVISALSPGTSGQVLRTQGAGANPVWGSAGTSLAASTSPSAVTATGDMTIAADNAYLMTFSLINNHASFPMAVYIRFNNDGSGSNYVWSRKETEIGDTTPVEKTVADSTANQIVINDDVEDSGDAGTIQGYILLNTNDPNSSFNVTAVGHAVGRVQDGAAFYASDYVGIEFFGIYNGGAATSVELITDQSCTGEVRLYKLTDS